MSYLLTLDESRWSEQLPALLDGFEADIAKAEPLFEIEGARLEALARDLPYHQSYYSQREQEAKHIVKWLDNHLSKIEARMVKNMSASNQRAFGARETTQIISGEREVVEHKQLIIEFSLIHGKLDSIVEAFKQMGWMIGNITKLRVASIQDAVI